MRTPALSLLVMPLATPALAHVETTAHVHSNEAAFWGLAFVTAAIIALALARRGG